MKKTVILMSGILAAGLLFQTAQAKDKKKADAKTAQSAAQDMKMDPKMAEAMKAMTPGENHRRLDVLAGKWTYSLEHRMDAASKPETMAGSSENRWILNGRFLQQEHKGQWMGQPFEGMSITGYDNMRGEYASFWLDNMGTGMMSATAQYDEAAKTINETGSYACPMTGEKNRKFRGALKFVDNDHYTYEMYGLDKDGKEFQTMKIEYTRAK